ncbi:MAG: Bro-N domain-containing protein [Ruminiclostridium sp.]
MNETIQIFRNEQFGSIRTITINGEPWFVGKDVAEILGYKNTKDALGTHVDDEDKKTLQRSEIATLENHIPKSALNVRFVQNDIPNRGLTIINESGLYSLILSSKLPKAKQFKRWVTSEVLPSIRKTGSYGEIDISRIIAETAAAVISEIMEQLAPILAGACAKNNSKPSSTQKLAANRYIYRQPSKIELLSPETKERVDEMLISGKYSCQQVANFIVNETGNYISTQAVTRYKREKLTVVGVCEQERFF